VRHLTAKPECVRAVAFLPDGRLVSASGKRSVTVWDPRTGQVDGEIRTRDFIFAIAVDPTGCVALAGRNPPGTDDSEIDVGYPDVEPRGSLRWPIIPSRERDRRARSIWSLAYTGDGHYLIAARRVMGGGNVYDGGDSHWWRRKPPILSGEFIPPHRGYAVGAARTGTQIAVTSQSVFALFDHPNRRAVNTHQFGATWAAAVEFLPTGTVVVGANAFLLFTDRLTARGNLQPLKTDLRTIRTLTVSPDGRNLLVGGSPGRVEVYDLVTREKLREYDFDVGVVQSLVFAPDGLTFAVGAEKGLILVDVE
jgi:WD40 repeat protein